MSGYLARQAHTEEVPGYAQSRARFQVLLTLASGNYSIELLTADLDLSGDDELHLSGEGLADLDLPLLLWGDTREGTYRPVAGDAAADWIDAWVEAGTPAWQARIGDLPGSAPAQANRPPEHDRAIPKQVLGQDPVTIDLGAHFRDADADALTFTAVSSDTDLVTVAVDGSRLTLTPGTATGRATVTVTAADEAASVMGSFAAVRPRGIEVVSADSPPVRGLSRILFRPPRIAPTGMGAVGASYEFEARGMIIRQDHDALPGDPTLPVQLADWLQSEVFPDREAQVTALETDWDALGGFTMDPAAASGTGASQRSDVVVVDELIGGATDPRPVGGQGDEGLGETASLRFRVWVDGAGDPGAADARARLARIRSKLAGMVQVRLMEA